jgi:hypothetical protein
MLRSIHRLAKSRALVRKDGLTRTSIAGSYSTESSPESSSSSISTSPEQEAIEEARMLLAVEEERMRSAVEKARIKSAVEKAKLKRKAIEASTTRVPTSKTNIVKGVIIKRASAKVLAAKGVATRNIPTKSIPIKTTKKDTTSKDVITKDATVKAATIKDTTTKAAVVKEPTAKVVVKKDATTKDATTTDVTAKDTTTTTTITTTDATTATNVTSSSPVKGDSPVRVANKDAIRNHRRALAWSNPRPRKRRPSFNKPPSEPALLPELPEPEFQPDPSPAKEEPTAEHLRREPLPKHEPLAEENYRRLGTELLSEHEMRRIAWLNSMSKDERNEHIRKTYGWSLEIPYSRELYYNPENRQKDHIIRKRFDALQQLRMIMGYSTAPDFKGEWLGELTYRLRKTNMRDVRFICIDTDMVRRLPEVREGERKRRVTSFHLGVAILDTRDIRDVVIRGINLPNPADLIKTYEFAVQTEVPEQDNFIFGKTQSISLENLKKKFIEWQRGRTVVGVAYSARNDLIILKDFDIYLDYVYWLDLCQATYLITQTPKAPTLSGLLQLLNIRHSKLHAAGNDAHFTLRALMGSAVLDVANELHYGGSLQPWCGLASSIAKAPLPLKEREELRERARQMEERKSARINWRMKEKLSRIPLPYG